MAAALREAALTLYGVNSGSGGGGMRLDLAEAWLYPALWAAQFAEKEDTFLSRWTKSVEDAGVAHSNMPSQYEAQPDALLGTRLPPPLQRQLLPDRGLSAVYFDQLSPCDYLPAVFDTLTALHAANPARFAKYAQLALALALVHDTPPPPDWPHGQVTPKALPRQLLPPATVFQYLTDTAEAGKSLQKLDQLTATELRFVVDIIAPETDLLWAQQNVKQPLSRLDATYGMVPYSTARLRAGVMVWPRPTYRLSELRGEGGICVDQAYFATQCGKARGVPTLLFRGAGMDGRHAWFGYLDGAKKWQLDAGRYEEQRYIAGFAHDPQTWADISDHELQFLSEGFRRLPTYRTSHVHALFAAALLDAGRLPAATRAARASVTAERRNVDGWELLLNLQKHESAADTKAREALLREAATALQRYPELNARYLREAVACVRARGDTAAADQEERMLARKFRSDRADLTIEQAGEMVKRAMAESSIAEAVRSYNLALTRFGKGQGIDFYDKVARPFVVYLATKGEKAEALKALARARNALNVQPGTQIDTEMTSLRMRLEALPAQAGKS
ncbi:hypothetical protein Ga0100231_017445 [Opitutaceae bacterium TAV4]|nr:hypothetical protein Ga0100231_017445 [Opitutaceae bacterium TAV4]RRK01089.1 hypothetical protein Ga0100230_013405 [Opitutaceae bacterium TAV3]